MSIPRLHRDFEDFLHALCDFIGREALARNKRATGRPKDLADLEILEKG